MSLIIRDMQIKITMRHHFIPVRMATIKKIRKYQVLARMWRNWNPWTLGGNAKWCSHYGKHNGGNTV